MCSWHEPEDRYKTVSHKQSLKMLTLKLDMSLFMLNTLTFTAHLHSYKEFTENEGKLSQGMRGRYKCQTVLAMKTSRKRS